jgi:hypothetical protein
VLARSRGDRHKQFEQGPCIERFAEVMIESGYFGS